MQYYFNKIILGNKNNSQKVCESYIFKTFIITIVMLTKVFMILNQVKIEPGYK